MTNVLAELRTHMLPGPLPRPDLSLPDHEVDRANLLAWLQFEQLWQLTTYLEEHPNPNPRTTRHQLRVIFHGQDRDLRSPAQHACLASVTRWTLLLIDHAEATSTPPSEATRAEGRREDLHGTRAIWAGQPEPPPTAEAERISRRIDEIRKRIRGG